MNGIAANSLRIILILGNTGKNFAAGMSGGIAYVLDRKHTLYRRINKDMVELEELQEKYDIEELRRILEEYVNETDSRLGREILSHFEEEVPCFKKVIARDYQRMIRTIGKYEERGISKENAQLEAFREISGQTA